MEVNRVPASMHVYNIAQCICHTRANHAESSLFSCLTRQDTRYLTYIGPVLYFLQYGEWIVSTVKVNVDLLKVMKNDLADVSSVSPSSEQKRVNRHSLGRTCTCKK